jgi:hypothetical protein
MAPDEMLERIWIEEGGGGTGQESYELCAYYYARTNCVRLSQGSGHKGYFFFIGDEGFYPRIDREQIRAVLGEDAPADLPAAEAFRRLQEKFRVFLIFPSKTFDERKADIDAEIRQRVTAAGLALIAIDCMTVESQTQGHPLRMTGDVHPILLGNAHPVFILEGVAGDRIGAQAGFVPTEGRGCAFYSRTMNKGCIAALMLERK